MQGTSSLVPPFLLLWKGSLRQGRAEGLFVLWWGTT